MHEYWVTLLRLQKMYAESSVTTKSPEVAATLMSCKPAWLKEHNISQHKKLNYQFPAFLLPCSLSPTKGGCEAVFKSGPVRGWGEGFCGSTFCSLGSIMLLSLKTPGLELCSVRWHISIETALALKNTSFSMYFFHLGHIHHFLFASKIPFSVWTLSVL